MVYGLARQSGGTARIESTPGEGTAVELCFRAAERRRGASRGHDDDQARRSAGQVATSILVIDDDPDVRRFIAEALTDEGFEVRHCAPTGRRA